jgi:hypothetical protein
MLGLRWSLSFLARQGFICNTQVRIHTASVAKFGMVITTNQCIQKTVIKLLEPN